MPLHLRAGVALLCALILAAPTAALAQKTVSQPGPTVPQSAIAFGAPGQAAEAVTPSNPLPVSLSGDDTGLGEVVSELQGLREDLAAPAESIPAQAPAAKGDTTYTRGYFNITTATDTALISSTSAQTGRLHEIFCTIDAAQTLTFKDGTTTLAGPFRYPSGGGVLQWPLTAHAYFETSTNTALNLTTTTTANTNCRVRTKKD